MLRVKGRGAVTKARTGDLLVTVQIVVPQRLDDAAREAVEAFAEATGADQRRAACPSCSPGKARMAPAMFG